MKRFLLVFACLVCASVIKAQNNSSYAENGVISYNSKTGKATINGVDVADESLQKYFSADDYKQFKSGRTLYTTGTVFGVIGSVPFGWCLGTMLAGGEVNTAVLAASGGVMVGGMLVALSGQNKMKQTISKYNATLSFSPTVTFTPINPDPAPALALRLTW